MRNTIRNTHLLSPYVASVQAIALICCFVVLFFSCEEEPPKSADKKIDQLVLTVGGTDTPVTFDADYNAALTVPFGTDLTAITVKTLIVSAKAMASIAQGDVLTITGGSTAITVTAEDGGKQVYTIQVTIAPAPPRTGADITALTATISGQTYSNMGANPSLTITNNDIAITLPFGSTLPAELSLTVLTLSAGASSVPAEGATLALTATGTGTINVTAEDGTTVRVYTVQVTIAAPRTGVGLTTLTATISGQTYSNMGTNPSLTITNNDIAITLPFGSTLPAELSLTVLTLSAGASSVPAEGATLDLSAAGVGMISVQAEDPSVATFSYTVSATILGQLVVTTYTGTDTLGIAVRDVVEVGRSVSFAAMDTVIVVSGLADVSFDWALGTLQGTKTATAGALALTQSDLAMFPATADVTYTFTVSANGETSEEKTLFYYPGQLRTWRDLQGMRVDLAGTYRMMRDIDFPDEDGDGLSEYNFEPVGRDTDANTDNFQGTAFSGTFDGGGRLVNNFYINRGTESFLGLFGQLTGIVRNVGLVGGMVTGNGTVGSLVGRNNFGTIQGAYATVAVTGISSNIGGLVGYNTGTVRGAYATGAVAATSFNIGGLVGYNTGTVQGAYATGAVTGRSEVGALVGSNIVGTVVGYARGNVTRLVGSALTFIGRLVGFNDSATATGYHSGQAGESQLLSMAADGTSTPLTGATGIDGTARTSASAQADFTGFDFTTNEIGQWIYTTGRWPALNLGDLQSAAEQPTQ